MEINKINYEIGVYDLESHFIDSSESYEYLEKEFEITKQQIRTYKTQLLTSIKNYQLVFKPVLINSASLPILAGDITKSIHGTKRIPVAKYYKDKLICVYFSMSEAEELTNINRGNISNSCKTSQKAGGIYTFKYIE